MVKYNSKYRIRSKIISQSLILFVFLMNFFLPIVLLSQCNNHFTNYNLNERFGLYEHGSPLIDPIKLDWPIKYGYINRDSQQIKIENVHDEISPKTASSGHPLTKNITNLNSLDEILFVAIEEDGEGLKGWLWDDSLNGCVLQHSWVAVDDTISPRAVAADIDGDGLDELIFAGHDGNGDDINAWAYDDAQHDYALLKHWDANDDSRLYAITTGDIDGDGIDEIIFAGTDGDGDDLNAWAFDDANTGFIELYHWDANDDYREPDVATGDIDGDGKDEIVFAVEFGEIEIYDDADEDFTLITSFHVVSNDARDLQIAMGDVDGDYLDEIIVAGTYLSYNWLTDTYDNGGLRACVYDDIYYGFGLMKQWSKSTDDIIGKWSVAVGNFDADLSKEFVFVNTDDDGEDIEAYFYDDAETDFTEIVAWTPNDNSSDPDVTVGDIDCDGQDEVVIVGVDGDDHEDINAWAFDNIRSGMVDIIHTWNSNDGGRQPVVACGDFDGDGIRMQYTGESWETTSDALPIVVMACAPLVEGISQNYVLSGTGYGTEISQGNETFKEVGVSIGASISFERGDPFGVVSASIKATLGADFSKTTTQTSLTSYGTSYISGYPDDVIIFQQIVFRSYRYTIISDPNNTRIDENIALSVPILTSIFKQSLQYFALNHSIIESNNETFGHVPGAVWTYPTLEEKDAIVEKYSGTSSRLIPIGQGNGITTVTIDVFEQTISSELERLNVGVEAGFSVCGAGFSASVGFWKTDIFSIITGSEVTYQGTVGDIAKGSDYNKYKYDFGMFVYNYKPNPNLGYQVINYWIENGPTKGPSKFVQTLNKIPGMPIGLTLCIAFLSIIIINRKIRFKTKIVS